MPTEIYEQRIKQLKEWIDNGNISAIQFMSMLTLAIEEKLMNEGIYTVNNYIQQSNSL